MPSVAQLHPATAIAIALLFFTGMSWWTGVYIAALAACALAGLPILQLLLDPIAITLQAVAGTYLLDRARIDPLTEVPNRKAFDERLEQEIARRATTQGPVTLLVWDIDDFKAINDNYGHRAGDRVLQTVAKCLAQGIRSTDFVARIGGEEFTMIMIGLSLDVAQQIANELRETVQMLRLHFRGTPVQVTLSCGIAPLQDNDTPGRAFERADAALYKAKKSGKNACLVAAATDAGSAAGA